MLHRPLALALAAGLLWSAPALSVALGAPERAPTVSPTVRLVQSVEDLMRAPDDADGGLVENRLVVPASSIDLSDLLARHATDAANIRFRITGTNPEGDAPVAVAFTPDGQRFLVAHRESRNILEYNAATRAFVREIAVNGAVMDMALSPDGTRIVTANALEDTAAVIDYATGATLATVPVGRVPGIVRFTGDGQRAVVGNTTSSDFSVISMGTLSEERRIAGGNFSSTISVNPEHGTVGVQYGSFTMAGDTIVHPRRFQSSILVANAATGASTVIPSVAGPAEAAVRADGQRAFVTHWLSNRTITEIDVATATIVRTIATPEDLWGPLSVNPAGTRAAVGIQNAARVWDLASATPGAPITATATVNQFHTTADGLYAFCVGFNGSLLSYATQGLVAQTNQFVSTTVGNVSPTEPLAISVGTTFGEDMIVHRTNGAAGGRVQNLSSGPDAEGDRCRTGAVTPDGTRAVAVNILSDSAAVFDVASGNATGFLRTGDRPADVAITPDRSKAVIANLDSAFTTIVSLPSGAVTNVPTGTRQSQVEISPDGRYAYVAVLASGDGVWRIDLNTNTVAGPKIATVDMGSVGYSYQQTHAMKLSPDGSVLAVAGAFTRPGISLIDTATWSFITDVAVPAGSLVTELAFSPDGTRLYAAARDTDRVLEFSNAGASSTLLRTIVVGDFPWQMAVTPDASKLFVLNWNNRNVGVVDLASGTQTTTIPLSTNPSQFPNGLALAGGKLHVAHGLSQVTSGGTVGLRFTQDGEVTVIDAATNAIVERIDTDRAPAAIYADATGANLAVPSPAADGLVLIDFAPACRADLNADGELTFDDIQLFVSLYNADDARADFNSDGEWTFDDIQLFVQLYNAGC